MVTNKDTLKLAHSAKCEGIIWKIILDENGDIIVWECRTQDKKVFFYAYDFKNEKTLLHNFKFDDSWELSINTVKNGILYFNGHESDFSPVQKGLLAFDLQSQKIIWQNFSISAQIFTASGIIVFDTKILPRKYKLLDFNTGALLNDVETKDLTILIPLGNKIFLPTITGGKDMLNTRYQLIIKDLAISSWYQQNNGANDQYLKVEKNGEILLEEIINLQIQKMSFDTFFVWHNRLVYIKNKTEIVSYFV
ncbi:MAG TPA: DUF4905 domain-containing protein [Pelobium sp.]